MKRFHCTSCGNELYFSSTRCLDCGQRVGYLPHAFNMTTLQDDGSGRAVATHDGVTHVSCRNEEHYACNWLVPEGEANGFCISCRHNRIIPDLSIPEHAAGWRTLELAKRQMFYSLLRWRLPMPTRAEDPVNGLVFDVLADMVGSDGSVQRVLTGHDSGEITLNIAEADDAMREKMRTDMHEPYRTLLGHFRHEIGHYYWDRLVRDGGRLAEFRDVFGDETADYAAALQRNYSEGPLPGWQQSFISAYASVHPWEDFAETWAHYTHMVDSLETARAYGMTLDVRTPSGAEAGIDFRPYEVRDVAAIADVWVPFTLALNSINRSMGQRDFYPFVMNEAVMRKLAFVHQLVHQRPAS